MPTPPTSLHHASLYFASLGWRYSFPQHDAIEFFLPPEMNEFRGVCTGSDEGRRFISVLFYPRDIESTEMDETLRLVNAMNLRLSLGNFEVSGEPPRLVSKVVTLYLPDHAASESVQEAISSCINNMGEYNRAIGAVVSGNLSYEKAIEIKRLIEEYPEIAHFER